MAFKKEVLKRIPIDCPDRVQLRQKEREKLKDIANGR